MDNAIRFVTKKNGKTALKYEYIVYKSEAALTFSKTSLTKKCCMKNYENLWEIKKIYENLLKFMTLYEKLIKILKKSQNWDIFLNSHSFS